MQGRYAEAEPLLNQALAIDQKIGHPDVATILNNLAAVSYTHLMFANKDDPHSIKVFDPSVKGETDRFAYRFVKP